MHPCVYVCVFLVQTNDLFELNLSIKRQMRRLAHQEYSHCSIKSDAWLSAWDFMQSKMALR